jgi:hypothetical protein
VRSSIVHPELDSEYSVFEWGKQCRLAWRLETHVLVPILGLEDNPKLLSN